MGCIPLLPLIDCQEKSWQKIETVVVPIVTVQPKESWATYFSPTASAISVIVAMCALIHSIRGRKHDLKLAVRDVFWFQKVYYESHIKPILECLEEIHLKAFKLSGLRSQVRYFQNELGQISSCPELLTGRFSPLAEEIYKTIEGFEETGLEFIYRQDQAAFKRQCLRAHSLIVEACINLQEKLHTSD